MVGIRETKKGKSIKLLLTSSSPDDELMWSDHRRFRRRFRKMPEIARRPLRSCSRHRPQSRRIRKGQYKQGWSQATTRRQVKNRLIPAFENCDLKDITTEVLQSYIAALLKKGNSAKYIRNIVSTMSAMWSIPLSWNYVTYKPFEGLILPPLVKPYSEAYSPEEAVAIFGAAREPFKTLLWIPGECGMRPAEVCGLDAKYIHLADCVVSVRQSESMGRIVTPDRGWLQGLCHFRGTGRAPAVISQREARGAAVYVAKRSPMARNKSCRETVEPLAQETRHRTKGAQGFQAFQRDNDGRKECPGEDPADATRP